MTIRLIEADMRDALRDLAEAGERFHACVCDPPYHLTSIVKRFGKAGAAPAQFGSDGAYARASRGFMGKAWDGGAIAFEPATWRAVYDVLLPGAHLLAFGGTRTYHRLVCAIEDAGFEIRDATGWLFGSGFPKSHDVSKGIDARLTTGSARTTDLRRMRMGDDYAPSERGRVNYDHGAGSAMDAEPVERPPATPEAAAWQGWGTALKPAMELICVARKPLIGSVAANVLAHGTGALNIDASRIPGSKTPAPVGQYGGSQVGAVGHVGVRDGSADHLDRWPANVIHDGSPEVEEAFAAFGERTSGTKLGGQYQRGGGSWKENVASGMFGSGGSDGTTCYGDSGSASRFFYSAKADKDDRAGSGHPTVKPIDLLEYLVRLVTPKGGHVLDPFAGSGTTGEACMKQGFDCTLVERDPTYANDIRHRIKRWSGLDTPLFTVPAEAAE